MVQVAAWIVLFLVGSLLGPWLVRWARRWRWRRATKGAHRAVEVGAYDVAERRLFRALKVAREQDQRNQVLRGLFQLIEIYEVHGRSDRAARLDRMAWREMSEA